ncbi:MAG: hypothetical protein ACW98U_02575 [Candidatus Thorarchaeota archaeon]|jgi:hypothetical protein
MSGPGLLQELERTERVLTLLLDRLSNLNAALEPIERGMRVTDFTSSGVYVPGMSRGIVCVPSGLIKGDPLEHILSVLGGRGIPVLIKAGDRSESQSTVKSIVNMIQAEDQKKAIEFVVNLRWSEFPKPLEKGNVAIIGTRYVKGDVKSLRNELEKLGVVIYYDDGEYGGGPLVHKFTKTEMKTPDALVVELTLSRSLSENLPLVTVILNVLASF